ncbi:MAG: PEP/pyruvate-binding domain-containing protein [Alphaproteobacteria bacterium]
MDGLSREPAFVLEGAAAQSAALAGGKASALARLAGVWAIPDFFVIAPHAFSEGGLVEAARASVTAALDRLGLGPFAVRSSGVEEDGAAAAHAGQFDTELNVARSDVLAAAHRIWRSGFSESLAEYRRAHGLSDAPQPPAVMVQNMVAARVAGVAFSADPVSGERNVVIISAIRGLADRLVAGEADGDTYRIGADGQTLAAELTEAAPVLTEAERAIVAKLARTCEAHFGAPQDVEWAFDGDALLLLQSRPITTLAAPQADDALTIWDNSNIVESYAGVTGALTFSFARYVYAHVYRSFSRLMGVPAAAVAAHGPVFENMLGRIDGRVYYNLLNWYRALALFPGFQANRRFMEEMMGVAEALPADLAERIAPRQTNSLARFADQMRFVRVGLGLATHGIRLKRTMARFQQRLDEALSRSNAEIDALSATDLAAEYRVLEEKLLTRWDAPLINDFLCMIAFGASRKALEKWAGAEGLALHADVMIGQGDIISAEPAQMIRAMGARIKGDDVLIARLASGDAVAVATSPALQSAFDAYIARFGDRCTQELKLESLTLDEDASQVLMAIAAAARAAPATHAANDDGKARLNALFRGKPLKHAAAAWLLRWAKDRVRDRENLRFERTRLFGRVRRIFRGIGAELAGAGALGAPRDVFYLTVDEALGAVEGVVVATDLGALAALRRAEDDASLARPDPPERFETHGAHLVGLAHLTARTTEAINTEETRSGLGCCAGVVTARVRVVEDPRKEALAPGEILVARHTDPGWIAVFANAAGVIAERGSLLSHSAIVAREMGIPCVVALKGAASWLKTGDLVRLDGGAGRVERLARA